VLQHRFLACPVLSRPCRMVLVHRTTLQHHHQLPLLLFSTFATCYSPRRCRLVQSVLSKPLPVPTPQLGSLGYIASVRLSASLVPHFQPRLSNCRKMTRAQSREYEPIPYVEDLEEYRPGGFHPVHLGDRLKGDQYRILNKIGHGSFCTVWLAEDTTTETCVAVSVQRADDSQGNEGTHNIKILRHLSKGDPDHPGHSQVLVPLDIFELSGPNGHHFCVVTPVQGQSLSMVIKRKLGILSEVLPLSKAKRAALDTIKAFAFIHKQHIVHGGRLLASVGYLHF
jgi:hypothetical protein